MSNSKKPEAPDPFMSIDPAQLENVAGGSARITARASAANDQIMTLLTSIGDSIKSLASAPASGQDPMQMMMMMMMMGGMGGGGGAAPAAAAAPPAPPPPPTINISTNVRRW